MSAIYCDKCGYEFFSYNYLAINHCIYCNSTDIRKMEQAPELHTNLLIPFKVDKNNAEKEVEKWLKKKYALIAADYKRRFKLSNIEGIYSPFWVYDADISCTYKGEGGKTYYEEIDNGQREKAWFYDTSGKITTTVKNIFVSDAIMHNNSIAKVLPYNITSITNMEDRYLNKFNIAQHYNGAEKSFDSAKIKMREPINDEIKKEISKRYDKAYVKEVHTEYLDVRYKEVLAPVWVGYCSYKEKKYYYIVNGQTGMVTGSYPVSASKAWLMAIAIIAVFMLLVIYGVT